MSQRLVVSPVVLVLVTGLEPAIAQSLGRTAPASNIAPADTRGIIARPLPPPPVPSNDPPVAFLEAARSALSQGRTGEAQEALERAETRLLDRAVDPVRADIPHTQRAVLDIGVARQALAARDKLRAARAIDDAVVAVSQPVPIAPSAAPSVVAVVPPPPPPGPPPVTYALLPGHWQLSGWRYVWIPPETTLHRVEERPFVRERYVWRDGAWVWVPGHYEDG